MLLLNGIFIGIDVFCDTIFIPRNLNDYFDERIISPDNRVNVVHLCHIDAS